MNAKSIVSKLKSQKGRHVPAVWQRTVKTLKNVPHVVTKQTTAFVRAGIDYENLASVREGIESGERGEVQGLPWGEWSEFPFIIHHNGLDYVRLYPAVFDNLKSKAEIQYFIDGEPATVEQVRPLCLASEFRESDPPCFVIKARDFLTIG